MQVRTHKGHVDDPKPSKPDLNAESSSRSPSKQSSRCFAVSAFQTPRRGEEVKMLEAATFLLSTIIHHR